MSDTFGRHKLVMSENLTCFIILIINNKCHIGGYRSTYSIHRLTLSFITERVNETDLLYSVHSVNLYIEVEPMNIK